MSEPERPSRAVQIDLAANLKSVADDCQRTLAAAMTVSHLGLDRQAHTEAFHWSEQTAQASRERAHPTGRVGLAPSLSGTMRFAAKLGAADDVVALTHDQARRRASRLLKPLLSAGTVPTSPEISALEEWLPLLEGSLFKFAVLRSTELELLRPTVRAAFLAGDAPFGTEAAAYWQRAVHMTTVCALAFSGDDYDWLNGLLASFPFRTWTPTWWMVAERSGWLALVAARCAHAFGPNALPLYSERLGKATNGVVVWDCALGLLAASHGHEKAAEDARLILDRRIKAGCPIGVDQEHFDAILEAAIEYLDSDANAFSAPGGLAKLDRRALGMDPLADASSIRSVLRELPAALASKLQDMFPSTKPSRPIIKKSDCAMMFCRAWSLSGPEASLVRH